MTQPIHRDHPLDALGSPIRREIIALLSESRHAVGELAAKLPVSRPAVSKHLRLLESAGLVACEAEGNRNMYRLESSGFEAARAWLDGFWGDALTRFRMFAENTAPENTAPDNAAPDNAPPDKRTTSPAKQTHTAKRRRK